MSKMRTLLCVLGLMLCSAATADAQVYGLSYRPAYPGGGFYGGNVYGGGVRYSAPTYGNYYNYHYSYGAPAGYQAPAYQVVPVVGVQKTTIRTIRVIRVKKPVVTTPCGCN